MRALASAVAIAVAAYPAASSAVTPAEAYAEAVAACSSWPLRTTGTVHYFCDCATGRQDGCQAGADSANGLTVDTPKQSVSAIVSAVNSMDAGDTIALCKGGAWSTSTVMNFGSTRSCSAAANMRTAANTTTCDIRDYDAPWGGTAKPIIRQTASANFGLLQFWDVQQAGFRILNLDLEGGGSGPSGGVTVGQRAIAMSNVGVSNDDFLICNNTINGWTWGVHLNAATGQRDDVWGNRFTNISNDGVLGAGNGTVIDANYFLDVGSRDVSTHAMYADPHNGASNIRIVNNEFRRSTGMVCQGVVLVVHGTVSGLVIENNLIDDGGSTSTGCWPLSVDCGAYPGIACYFTSAVIRRNRINTAGYNALAVGQAPGVIIEDNIIYQHGGRVGIAAPYSAARTSPADAVMSGAQIRNNTIYQTMTSAQAILSQIEGTGHVIANNTITQTGLYGACFMTELGAGAYAHIGQNACYGGSWRTTYDDPAGRITANPLFTAAPTDFTLQTGSPLVGAANATYCPADDFRGYTRPSPPSIGAYDTGSGSSSGGSSSSSSSSSSGGSSSSSSSSSSGGSSSSSGGGSTRVHTGGSWTGIKFW